MWMITEVQGLWEQQTKAWFTFTYRLFFLNLQWLYVAPAFFSLLFKLCLPFMCSVKGS